MKLEDNAADIVGKALRGLNLDTATLARTAGLTANEVEDGIGKADPAVLRAIAPALGLNVSGLLAVAAGAYEPDAGVIPPEVLIFTTPFGDMEVNSFLIADPAGGSAVAFDTGSDCDGMLEALDARVLKLSAILLTHAHGDHIYDLDRLREKTGAPAWITEPVDGAETFEAGRTFSFGSLKIETRLTWGHSPAGITYVVSGLCRPVAVVGDALFAGSMGGGKVSYADALRTTRSGILTLPRETLLCPGHGPMTSAGYEADNNPFSEDR